MADNALTMAAREAHRVYAEAYSYEEDFPPEMAHEAALYEWTNMAEEHRGTWRVIVSHAMAEHARVTATERRCGSESEDNEDGPLAAAGA